jgi:sugar (pentulose or hexulose) kinase
MHTERGTLVLGVDLGTTATKAALYDLRGRSLSEGRAEVPLYHLKSGAVEQELEDFYQSAAAAIRECIGSCNVDPAQVAGIAFDSQMAESGELTSLANRRCGLTPGWMRAVNPI